MPPPPGRLASLALVLVAACAGPAPDPPEVSTDAAVLGAASVDAAELLRAIEEAHARFAALSDGEVSAHNDVAARTDPALFAIAVATVDGEQASVGDDDVLFPLQSLSKTFTLARALEDVGPDALLTRVGMHATGLPFGALAAFEVRATPLQNPMVSAGAIMTTGLVTGADKLGRARWRR